MKRVYHIGSGKVGKIKEVRKCEGFSRPYAHVVMRNGVEVYCDTAHLRPVTLRWRVARLMRAARYYYRRLRHAIRSKVKGDPTMHFHDGIKPVKWWGMTV